MADERGVDFEEHAIEGDGAVFGDFSPLFDAKEGRDIIRSASDTSGKPSPAVSGRFSRDATVWRQVVFTLDPGEKAAVEAFKGGEVVGGKHGQKLKANGSKPSLDLPLSLGKRASKPPRR